MILFGTNTATLILLAFTLLLQYKEVETSMFESKIAWKA